jgi:hypothetical protein
MEENVKAPFWKPALIYGAIMGAVSVFIGLVFYFLGLTAANWTNLVSLAISIAVLVYCLVLYRKDYLGGFASFRQIFLMALVAGVFSAIISALFTMILFKMDPQLIEAVRIAAEEKILNNPRVPESMYDTIFERIEKSIEPTRMFTQALIIGIVGNAIVGLIAAAFIKREQSPLDAAV